MSTIETNTDLKLGRWDRLGVWASVACAVHCLVAPLIFLAIPAFSGIWAHPGSHALMAALVLPLACIVLLRGYRVHQKRWIGALATVGVGCIMVGCALPLLGGDAAAAESSAGACASCCPQIITEEDGGTSIGWPSASIVTVAGSVLLAVCHFGNIACRRCCAPAA